MTFNIGRRDFLMGTTALAAAAAMGGPASAAAERMRMLFWGGQARADRTYGVTDLYTKATGTVVEGDFAAFGDYWPKLATQVAGGNSPDIIQMDYRYIVEYATRGSIAPLDEFVGKELDLSDFDADQLEGGKVNGQLYGVSLGANSAAAVINTRAFEEAGVEPPNRDTTYADLPAMAEKFNSGNKRAGMKMWGDQSYLEPALENFLRQRGKALYTTDGQLAFDPQDAVDWFQLWADLRAAGVTVSPEDQALDVADAIDTMMITLGKSAVTYAHSNQLVAIQQANPDPLTITNYPRIEAGKGGGHYRKPSMFWSMGATSAIKSDVASFITFFIGNPEAGKLLGVERGIPCDASNREAVAPTLDALGQTALSYVSSLGDLAGPIPPPPPSAAGEISIPLLRTKSQEVGFGQITPQEGGEQFHAEAAAILLRAKQG